VMSFGSPTPVEVVVSGVSLTGPKAGEHRAYADAVYRNLAAVGGLRDVQFGQPLDYPTVEVKVDRYRAAASKVTADDVARAVTPFTSSSRFTVPNYWRDPASGVGYQVQVEVPQALMRSATDVATVPVHANGGNPLLVRDVADVKEGIMPGEIDRYNQRRLVSLTANIEGDDLGDVAAQISKARAAAGNPPQGVNVDVRGQVAPFQELFRWLGYGLLASVAVIFLLLTAYFQSVRLTLTAVAAVPAVLCGVGLALLVTRSTLNLQSFMGAIMAVGVATANAILLVTFAERARGSGLAAPEAAVAGARARVRPIVMTSAAMLAGIVWMLFLRQTTISVPALTGAIMAMGIATANSILVVSFAREALRAGADALAAAIEAGYSRLRPVLMTALAMIIGMVPMALGLGEGGEQNAPLGRAVIGGLLFATLATLFLVPVVFAMIHGWRGRRVTAAAVPAQA